MKLKTNIALGIVAILISSTLLVLVPVNVQAEYTGDVIIDGNGNVNPLDAPIEVHGSKYRVTDDIKGTITILKPGISFNGDGHTIQGSGSGFGIYLKGLSEAGLSEVTVKNCYVDGFTVNIRLEYSTECTIKDNVVTNSGMAAIALWWGSNENTVKGNHLKGNSYGIKLLFGCEENTVKDNIVEGTTYEGIDCYQSSNNMVKGNVVKGSNDYGISFRYSDGCMAKDNLVMGYSRGYYILVGDDNIICDNEAVGCFNGIMIVLGDSNIIRGNTVHDSTNNGIVCSDSYNTRITENLAYRNAFDGIFLWDADNNEICGNVLYENAEDGIRLRTSDNNVVCGNVLYDHPEDAIDLWTSHENIIEGNEIYHNFIAVFLDQASAYNTIRENVIWENKIGVVVYHRSGWDPSHDNMIYHNDFYDSAIRHARDFHTNTWDNGAGEGNYWDDYGGVDADGDGIGDTPYANDLDEVLDHFPLMEPWN